MLRRRCGPVMVCKCPLGSMRMQVSGLMWYIHVSPLELWVPTHQMVLPLGRTEELRLLSMRVRLQVL